MVRIPHGPYRWTERAIAPPAERAATVPPLAHRSGLGRATARDGHGLPCGGPLSPVRSMTTDGRQISTVGYGTPDLAGATRYVVRYPTGLATSCSKERGDADLALASCDSARAHIQRALWASQKQDSILTKQRNAAERKRCSIG